jgi:hypothetical protein
VFEDQLFLRTGFEQDRKLVEASDSARQFRAIQQVNDYGRLLTSHRVEKGVLNILWCLFTVRHDLKPGGEFVERAVARRLQHGSLPDKGLPEMLEKDDYLDRRPAAILSRTDRKITFSSPKP